MREPERKWWLALLILVGGAAAAAEGGEPPARKLEPTTKVSADLARLLDESSPPSRGAIAPGGAGAHVVGGYVTIDAVAAADAAPLKSELQALGMQDAVVFGRIVSGRLPISSIGALEALPSLKFARPAEAATNLRTLSPRALQSPAATLPAQIQDTP